jgi:hypothetical protein
MSVGSIIALVNSQLSKTYYIVEELHLKINHRFHELHRK